MTDYVHRKFPEHIAAVEVLREKDSTFRSVCADYEELCAWLAARCQSEDPSFRECSDAWALGRDLEDEILTLLEEYNDNIR
jgi:uncharacterized protein YdcH (DUF465 family)